MRYLSIFVEKFDSFITAKMPRDNSPAPDEEEEEEYSVEKVVRLFF